MTEYPAGKPAWASAASVGTIRTPHSTHTVTAALASLAAGLTSPGLAFSGFRMNAFAFSRHVVQMLTIQHDNARCGVLCPMLSTRRTAAARPRAARLRPSSTHRGIRSGSGSGHFEEIGRTLGLIGVFGRPCSAGHDACDLGKQRCSVGPPGAEFGHGRQGNVAPGVLGGVEPDVVVDGPVEPREQDPRGLVVLVYGF
jgi:hypothetical protein